MCRPSSGDDLVVIKTHFPNIGPEINESEDCISGVILLIRHPVDQFLARAAVARCEHYGSGEGNEVLCGPGCIQIS